MILIKHVFPVFRNNLFKATMRNKLINKKKTLLFCIKFRNHLISYF